MKNRLLRMCCMQYISCKIKRWGYFSNRFKLSPWLQMKEIYCHLVGLEEKFSRFSMSLVQLWGISPQECPRQQIVWWCNHNFLAWQKGTFIFIQSIRLLLIIKLNMRGIQEFQMFYSVVLFELCHFRRCLGTFCTRQHMNKAWWSYFLPHVPIAECNHSKGSCRRP